jgi:indole-3-pyruvate monooxygenase
MEETLDAVVIGAGMAGLGAGAALRAGGVRDFAILEQGRRTGHFWTQVYDRLQLHSAFHDMPEDGGARADYAVFMPRDQLLDYLARYAERHGLPRHLRFETHVQRVKRLPAAGAGGAEWELSTSRGTLRARSVAVATAINRVPKQPELSGRERFRGQVLHSASYRSPKPFAGRAVLVVGSGNSAAEIALDLVEGGAREVAMWVRGPRHFIPLSRMAKLFRFARLLGQFTPEKLAEMHRLSFGTPAFDEVVAARDRIGKLLSVDLSKHGIRRPERGPFYETFHLGRIPTFDVGAIAKIKSGAIRVIDGNRRPLEALEEGGVRLGGELAACDDVILATGFEPRLDDFVADAELLGPVRWHPRLPLTDGRGRSRIHPSIFFPGFDVTPLGGVSLGRFGWEAGERMAEALAGAPARG